MYLSLSVLVSDTIMSWVTLSKHALRARIHRIHTHGLHKLPIVHGFHTRLVQFRQGKTELNSKLTNVNKNLLITRLRSKKKSSTTQFRLIATVDAVTSLTNFAFRMWVR